MAHTRKPLVSFISLATVAYSLCIAEPPLRAQKQQVDLEKRDSTEPENEPNTLAFILRALSSKTYPKKRLINKVRTVPLDFDKRPANVAAVRAATKDEELYQLIVSKMKPWPPPQPPPSPTGSVLAICEPAECEITLNGSTVPSEHGQRLFLDLQPGSLTVKFSGKQYETQEKILQVKAGERSEVGATLELTNLEKAKHWRDEMWKALGAGEHGEGAQVISATGSATIYDSSGKETNWGISINFSPGTSTVALRSPSGNKTVFVLECNGEEDCKQQPAPKNGRRGGGGKSAIDADVATLALRDFRKNHLGSILKRLSSLEVRLISTTTDATGVYVLHFEDSEVGYEVRMLPNFLIAQVALRSKIGLGEITLITYSEYEPLAKSHAQYPKKTVYKSGEKRGVKAELSWPK